MPRYSAELAVQYCKIAEVNSDGPAQMPHMFEDKPADEPMIEVHVTLHTMKKTDLQQRMFR